ncbi:hypothetical protein BO71DRAFT_405117 [Aspergillus ellipticus CBS 707.79]|uniref:Secreted protein n=1 Tax=Aspergillus ellipticus CBS 707.79 TaxID=1448320 RepID=A0A319F489_9EURO|nr:hypothetical protein BO71DRAFT_405117 [Aspergillus ellipticus CBS 707.79]
MSGFAVLGGLPGWLLASSFHGPLALLTSALHMDGGKSQGDRELKLTAAQPCEIDDMNEGKIHPARSLHSCSPPTPPSDRETPAASSAGASALRADAFFGRANRRTRGALGINLLVSSECTQETGGDAVTAAVSEPSRPIGCLKVESNCSALVYPHPGWHR